MGGKLSQHCREKGGQACGALAVDEVGGGAAKDAAEVKLGEGVEAIEVAQRGEAAAHEAPTQHSLHTQ